ncbi:hypothetical protein V5799_011051 [Amblyomma americanum]|uniref:Uncharacterized protein n=1 Tax=Amblyomma americanum TaxID=6943 RepID=A0AAQ4EI16_AMBAM
MPLDWSHYLLHPTTLCVSAMTRSFRLCRRRATEASVLPSLCTKNTQIQPVTSEGGSNTLVAPKEPTRPLGTALGAPMPVL